MRAVDTLLAIGTAVASVAAADTPRPRGVGPEFGKFYKAADKFACISNPSVVLDVAQVNDDYCDCPDGSDEPGTSACSYLSDLSPSTLSDISINESARTLALPGFYCRNKGHQPSYVPFLSVNDGVCDHERCCDGSDEWARVGGISCENKCKEIGKEWKKNEEIRQKALGAAQKKRKELVADAAKRRKEVEDRIETLRTQVEGAEVKVKSAQATLAEVERQERGKVIRGPAKASKLGVLAGLAKERIEELRTSLTDVRFQRDSAKSRLAELETILTTFKEEYNPNFNDEGVKRAVRSWEEFAAREKPWEGDEAHDRDLDEIAKPDSEGGAIKWEDWEKPEEDSDVDVLYKVEEYLPVAVRDWADKKLRDLRLLLIENGIIAPSRADSDSESKALTDARSSLKAAEDSVNDNKNELTGHEEDLRRDYGLDDVFRVLKGQCVSKDSGEYTYELCWMEQTKQKPKKRGGDTGMGNFVRFDTVTVDDDVPADGKGLGSGKRVALRYENGQHCWNGPNRSTLVVLACAESDEIWKITEEEKCVYRMEVGTPAVCSTSAAGKPEAGKPASGTAKDEL